MDPTTNPPGTDAAGTTIEADKPDLRNLGRVWYAPDRGVAAIEVLRPDGSDSGHVAVVRDEPEQADRFRIDIWRTTDMSKVLGGLFGGERVSKAIEAEQPEQRPRSMAEIIARVPPTERPRDYAAFAAGDADAALVDVRDRCDRVRRGWCGADQDAARAECRVAAVMTHGDTTDAGAEARRRLVDADRAIGGGELLRAANALDGLPPVGGGPGGRPPAGRNPANAKAWALESAHGSRSQDEWEQRLNQRGYGLVATNTGNKTEWMVRDLRSVHVDESGRTTAQDFSMDELGFREDAEPAKLRAAWAAGQQANIRDAMIREDVLSSSAPQVFSYDRDHAKLSASAARADIQRNGLSRAMQSLIAGVGDADTWQKIDKHHKALVAEAVAAGEKDPAVTLDMLSDRCARAGMTFGSMTGDDGDRMSLTLVGRLARMEPPTETRDHMQRWLSATVWSAQNEMVNEKQAPTFAAFEQKLATKGISVERTYDAERKQFDYEFSASVAGVGHFSHADKDLGFDGNKDPRLSMHAFVEAGEQVAFREKAERAVERGNQQAEKLFSFTNRDKAVRQSLEASGMRTRIIASEVVGKDHDGLLVRAYRMGIEDTATGRIMPAEELGVVGTSYVRQDGRACDFRERVQVRDTTFREQAKSFGAAIADSFVAFASRNNMDINKTTVGVEQRTPRAPSVSTPSWHR